ncbi:MAG: hypothetical protein H3Z50_06110 [archaeon]|nr:hypothetical protein [archaeon]MCP8306613.1 hypothetical protein [archaeon]
MATITVHHKIKTSGDIDVQDWLNTLALRSENTAKTYLAVLKVFSKAMDPTTLTERDGPAVKRWLLQKASKLAPKTANLYISAIKSWLNHRKVKVDLDISISNVDSTPSLENEKIPEKHQVREVLLSLDVRGRAIASLISFCGLRFYTQSNLKLGDMVELDLEKLEMKKTPALIHVPAGANKGRRSRYFVFLIEEGCEYLLAYLKHRKGGGEDLTKDSPLISRKGRKRRGRKLHQLPLAGQIRSATRRTLKARPYVLRSYFDWSLLNAKIPSNWQSFFMGHKGNVEAVYTTRKHLPQNLIDQMREIFRPVEEYLSTTPKPASMEEQRKRDFLKTAVLSGWFKDGELDLIRQMIKLQA